MDTFTFDVHLDTVNAMDAIDVVLQRAAETLRAAGAVDVSVAYNDERQRPRAEFSIEARDGHETQHVVADLIVRLREVTPSAGWKVVKVAAGGEAFKR